MPLLYPDVIKLDLRVLDARDPADLARVVTAVGDEAERRHATVLAEGIDSEAQLATARAAGATPRPGLQLREAGPPPGPPPRAARPRCPSRAGRCAWPAPAARPTARSPTSASRTGAGRREARRSWPSARPR